MTAYSDNSTNIITNIIKLPRGVYGALKLNGTIIKCLVLIIPLSILFITKKEEKSFIKKDLYFKAGILSMFAFTILTIYWGLKYFTYYLLPVLMFISIAFLGISLYFKKN